MMSVMIKGMEMPEECLGCPFESYHECLITHPLKMSAGIGRAEWCPLKDVEEVKHGEWQTEKREVYGLPAVYHVCSKCGTEYPATFMAACCADFEEDKAVFDYCPKCGAKMDGKEKNDVNNDGFPKNS